MRRSTSPIKVFVGNIANRPAHPQGFGASGGDKPAFDHEVEQVKPEAVGYLDKGFYIHHSSARESPLNSVGVHAEFGGERPLGESCLVFDVVTDSHATSLAD